MRTPARMLTAATLTVLTVLPAGVAQAGAADESGQHVLERTLAREHHAVAAPANPAAPAAKPYRNYHEALAAQEQATEANAVERFRRSERASQEQHPANAVERFRRGERASQDQTGIADDSQRPPTETQGVESWRHPGNVRARSAEPSGRPGWLVPGLGVLAAALVLAGGLAVTTTRRARRRVRVGQAV